MAQLIKPAACVCQAEAITHLEKDMGNPCPKPNRKKGKKAEWHKVDNISEALKHFYLREGTVTMN